ncbi:MAG TPA: hypothetical protein VGQ72_03905 [Pyrinomonadaceae bacterium]|nr:hypothetical protein [Pyrinomonadaceae bacterium]
MSKTIGATFLSLIVTAAAVVFALNSLSKPVTTHAATLAPVSVSESVRETAAMENFTYNGRHSDWVRKLLTRVGSWRCPSNASDSGAPPSVKAEECTRDTYVAAAVLYAWAAECYARQEEDSKAGDAADQMYENLKNAKSMCSDAPSIGPARDCDTLRIFGCDEPL